MQVLVMDCEKVKQLGVEVLCKEGKVLYDPISGAYKIITTKDAEDIEKEKEEFIKALMLTQTG